MDHYPGEFWQAEAQQALDTLGLGMHIADQERSLKFVMEGYCQLAVFTMNRPPRHACPMNMREAEAEAKIEISSILFHFFGVQKVFISYLRIGAIF